MIYKLGIDLGGTSAKIGLVAANNKVVKERNVRTAGFPKPGQLAKELAYVAKEMAKGFRVKTVGVGIAGDIDFAQGLVRVSPNLKWNNVPFKKLFQKETTCQVKVDNDANVAAWGVFNTQVPKGVKHVLVLTLGTGVGGGIVLDGKVHRGATGSAGEFGHLTIVPDGLPCNCGDNGCLEAYVGGVCLVKNVGQAIEGGATTSLEKIYSNNPEDLTPLEIFNAAKAGDEFALKVWKGVGKNLGRAIGNLVYLFNPEMIFLTGGIASAGELILKPLRDTLYSRAFYTPTHAVKIKVAKNAHQMGLIGAALL